MTTRFLMVLLLVASATQLKTAVTVRAEEIPVNQECKVTRPLDSSVHKVIDSVNIVKTKCIVLKEAAEDKVALLQRQQHELEIVQKKLDSLQQVIVSR